MVKQDLAPLVRDQHGANLGVDWRRVPGMVAEGLAVPGRVPAHAVMPGDRVLVDGSIVTVIAARSSRFVDVLHLVVVSDAGAEVVHERSRADRIEVVEVGAFDR